MQDELEAVDQVLELPDPPAPPRSSARQGLDQARLLGNLLANGGRLFIGGGMASFPGHALGTPSANRCASMTCCRRARDQAIANAKGREIVLPVDAVGRPDDSECQHLRASPPSSACAPDEMILDIGPRSIEHVCSVLLPA